MTPEREVEDRQSCLSGQEEPGQAGLPVVHDHAAGPIRRIKRTAVAAWDGTQKIRLGDSVTADLTGTETHQFAFFVPEGTKLTMKVKPVKGTDLVPGLELVDSTLSKIDTGAKPTNVENFVLPAGGAFGLRQVAQLGFQSAAAIGVVAPALYQ